MDSFHQLIELAYEALNSLEKFLSKSRDLPIDEARNNYYKSQEICKAMVDKMNKVEISHEGSNFGYDSCVYYMAQDTLNQYQYAALLVFTRKLGDALKEVLENKGEKQQKESFKSLIKEAI